MFGLVRRRTPFAVLIAAGASWGQAPPPPAKAPADRPDGPPVVSAKAWAVADAATGKLLGAANEADPLPMASTTKIMTAHVVLRLAAADPKVLAETVSVSERAAKTGGSSAKLMSGDRFAVRDLLYGLLLPSGNDAAAALAEHFGPRLAEPGKPPLDPAAPFVAEMNRRAEGLKLAETKYFDPHGLGKNQSSARNLVRLAAEAMGDERFRGYVGTRRHECEAIGPDGAKRQVVWENTNKLLGIDGYDGVKTGTTTAAGSCLVGSGRRGDDRLIVVVLGCTSNDSRYVDSRNLFRWGWQQLAPPPGK